MKFQQRSALEKQIEQGNFLRSYLIFHPNKEERKKLLVQVGDKIASAVQGKLSFCEGKDWESVYQILSAPSLFGDQEVILWDIGKTTEDLLEKIQKYIFRPSPWAVLVIGAEGMKPFTSLYKGAEKEIGVLDLSEEKPWEKEKRQQQDLVQIVQQEGKDIAQSALLRLLSQSNDSFTLQSELSKVLAYVGQKKVITEQDVIDICSAGAAKGWQVGEEILWEKQGKWDESMDASALLALIGQIRFLIQQARQILWGLQEKKTVEELSKKLSVRPASLQKIISRLKLYSPLYLEEAFNLLYDIEILTKNSALETQFLFRYLCVRFTALKGTHDKTTITT